MRLLQLKQNIQIYFNIVCKMWRSEFEFEATQCETYEWERTAEWRVKHGWESKWKITFYVKQKIHPHSEAWLVKVTAEHRDVWGREEIPYVCRDLVSCCELKWSLSVSDNGWAGTCSAVAGLWEGRGVCGLDRLDICTGGDVRSVRSWAGGSRSDGQGLKSRSCVSVWSF